MRSEIYSHLLKKGIVSLLGIGLSLSVMATEKNIIPVVDELDLSQESDIANGEGKQLVVIYRQPGCDGCQEFIQDLASSDRNSPLFAKSKFYQVNTEKGIDVVCPSGLELSDEEFYQTKGIEGRLSIVFHDREGNVIYTHNGIPTMSKLASLAGLVQKKQYSRK